MTHTTQFVDDIVPFFDVWGSDSCDTPSHNFCKFTKTTQTVPNKKNTSRTMSYQYSSVEHGDTTHDASAMGFVVDGQVEEQGRVRDSNKIPRPFVYALLVVCALAATMVARSSAREADSTTQPLDLLGMANEKLTTRSCTFDECYEANCNFKVAPFICLRNNGGPHMGCSPTAWLTGTCEESCNLSGCTSLEIPEDTPTCEGVPCGDDWCKGGQVCPSAASFQCQEGSARFGCSADKFQWSLRSDVSTCSKCCDASLC